MLISIWYNWVVCCLWSECWKQDIFVSHNPLEMMWLENKLLISFHRHTECVIHCWISMELIESFCPNCWSYQRLLCRCSWCTLNLSPKHPDIGVVWKFGEWGASSGVDPVIWLSFKITRWPISRDRIGLQSI